MKRHAPILLLLVAITLLAASCQKNDDPYMSSRTFRAFTDRSSKSHLDGLNVVWNNSDSIIISNGTDHSVYSATNVQGTSCQFQCLEGDDIEGTTFYAIHPAYTFVSHNSMHIPTSQHYRLNNIENSPMYAVSHEHTLYFCNLCGVLKLSLHKPNTVISHIRITTDKRICGDFPISQVTEDGETRYQVLADDAPGNRTIQLHCGPEGTDISTPKDFFIYLPVGDYQEFSISIVANDQSFADLTAHCTPDDPIHFNRNHIKVVSRSGSDLHFQPQYAIDGPFSIDDDHTVFFSRGNLQYNRTGNTETWTFAEHQYDYYSSITADHMDRFCWPDTHTHYGTTIQGQHNQIGCDHAFTDWGDNVISGEPANKWRTLTAAEWHYLLFQRRTQGKMVNNIPEYAKCHFTINGQTINMLVIYPDAFPAEYIIHSQEYGHTSDPQAAYEWTTQSQADYELLNSLGCAMLPLAGFDQQRQNGNLQLESVNHMGRYASATNDVSNPWYVTKYYLDITNNGYVQVGPNIKDDISIGNAVRLVQNNY